MKALLLTLALITVATLANAQDSQEKYIADVAQHTCDCMEETPQAELDEDAETVLGLCILGYVTDNLERHEVYYGKLDFGDEQTLVPLAEAVGEKAFDLCPSTMMIVVMKSLPDSEKDKMMAAENSFTGTFQGYEGNDLVTLIFKEDTGKTVKLLWLDYFPGSEQLVDGESAVGESFTVSFTTLEVFSAASGDYEIRRVITGVE